MVLDSTTSNPVKRATIRLIALGEVVFEDDQRISALSDEEGRFGFKNVPPGNYELRVEHPGFVAARHSAQRIRLKAGQDLRDLTARLTPAAVITGRVVNEHGEPMPNVSVQAMRYMYSAAGRRLQAAGGANTDDQGQYRMFGLAPGRYYVRASLNMGGESVAPSDSSGSGVESAPKMKYPPTYYPGVVSPEAASLVDVRPADQADVDFSLTPVAGVYVRGRVPGDSEGALASVVVLLNEDGMQGEAMVRNGAFELAGILPGTYTLAAMEFKTNGQQPRRLAKTIQVGQSDLNNVELEATLALSGTIHGQVLVAGDSHPDLSRLMVALQPVEAKQQTPVFQDGNGRGNSIPGLAMVQKDGSFVMGMPADGPGVYFTALSARGPGVEDFYTKSVSYGGKDITESGLNLPTSAVPMQIVIAGDGAVVQGRVTDAKNQPVDSATVVAIPANSKLRRWAELYQPVNTDQNGQFMIRGLRPGDYCLYAWQDIDSYAFLDPDFMRPYERRGQALKAEARGRYAIALRVLDEEPPQP